MQLDFLRFLQSASTPLLDLLAQGLTMMGEPVALALVFCAVYWCIDKESGRGLIIALCASLCLNGFIKDLIKAPRPIGEEGITSLRVHTAHGYSFPSGHTQSAAVFWTSLALWLRRRRVKITAVLLIVLVGLSRMYLGLHYPVDVLGGLLLGCGSAALFHRLLTRGSRRTALALCALLALLALAFGEGGGTLASTGMTAGLFAGLWLEGRFVGFRPEQAGTAKKIVRYGLGLVFVGAVFLGLRTLLPSGELWKALRYGLVVFAGIGLYPLLFTRCGL